jgi:hypothetical protein
MPVGGRLKFVGFPDIDGDVVEARILLPQGTPLERTEIVVARVVNALDAVDEAFRDRQPDRQDLVRSVTAIYGQNPDAYETGPHVARVVADLLGAEQRDAALDAVMSTWREAVGEPPDVIGITYTEPAIGPGGRPIDLRLTGPDLGRLKAASNELQGYLSGFAGVQDLSDDLRPGKREYRLRLKPDAGVLGLDARLVAEQLRAAFQGVKVDELHVGAEAYEVNLRVAGADRASPADLEAFLVTGTDGALIPLSAVAEIEQTRGWARINRVDGRRAVTVQGDVDRDVANARELLAMTRTDFTPGLLERYPDVRFEVEGESKESAETGRSIVRNVLLGLIGVYMLLALQFRGYLAPITVMLVIPTALIGVVLGHMALGLDMTMPSIVGMASLFGVVVNDSILLVVFIRQARARGLATLDAAKQAARARFRPILLTSVTTIAGLTPLLLEKSLQAQFLIPLAASLAFGLTTARLGPSTRRVKIRRPRRLLAESARSPGGGASRIRGPKEKGCADFLAIQAREAGIPPFEARVVEHLPASLWAWLLSGPSSASPARRHSGGGPGAGRRSRFECARDIAMGRVLAVSRRADARAQTNGRGVSATASPSASGVHVSLQPSHSTRSSGSAFSALPASSTRTSRLVLITRMGIAPSGSFARKSSMPKLSVIRLLWKPQPWYQWRCRSSYWMSSPKAMRPRAVGEGRRGSATSSVASWNTLWRPSSGAKWAQTSAL